MMFKIDGRTFRMQTSFDGPRGEQNGVVLEELDQASDMFVAASVYPWYPTTAAAEAAAEKMVRGGTIMTKSEELAIVRGAARALGDDSYLGPWLKREIGQIALMLQSDIAPMGNLSIAEQIKFAIDEAKREASEIVLEAEARADEIIDLARVEADTLKEAARDSIIAPLRSARAALERALEATE
jgi:cell division septum initiation protein DivIVA